MKNIKQVSAHPRDKLKKATNKLKHPRNRMKNEKVKLADKMLAN